ncbi:protein Aster-B-like isoform X2 [Heptranchias perlo]|uniref:protein Aster-B-like isoform X2 n=1 Tax=Heptranchias perlo TaxID=212740 RepID=UPI0035598AC4
MLDTASNSARSTPTSSPALRKRLLLSSKAMDVESMVEKGSDSSSERQTYGNQYSYSTPGRNSKNTWKIQSWYNVLSPTYKQRNEDFHKLFKKLPDSERLIVDYSCALQRDILLQGRIYISENWVCFYSNIFRWETLIALQFKDITGITKEKTAKLIPNAIQICTDNERHFFTSLGARDRSYLMIFRLWQNALMEKPLSNRELWHIVHQCYGTELGLTSDDDDYMHPNNEFNGKGIGEELDAMEMNDTSSRSSVEMKLNSSPQTDHQSCLTVVDGTDTVPLFSEQPIAAVECEVQAASSQEVTLVTEQPTPPLSGNLSSLDFIDDDIPTDLSDSSETQDDGEVEPFCTDLGGRLYINLVFRMAVDELYEMLFTDSQFLHHFLDNRRFTDVTVAPWRRDSNGNQSRVLTYTIAISNPLGPKSAPGIETQTLYKSSQKSECYIVDSEVVTQGIPYQDYFYTVNRYCLMCVARNKCRLRVSSEIHYRKQPWNLVKNFIERNTMSGLAQHFQHLELELVKVEKLLKANCSRQSLKEKHSKSGALRRRKRAHCRKSQLDEILSPLISPSDKETSSRNKRVSGSLQSKYREHVRGCSLDRSVSNLLLIISFILVVLIVLNVMLFYKLWALEQAAQTLEAWRVHALSEGKIPQTAVEWAHILQLQKSFHDAELQKWRHILKACVGLLDEMKFSLERLHKGIALVNLPAESEESTEDPF